MLKVAQSLCLTQLFVLKWVDVLFGQRLGPMYIEEHLTKGLNTLLRDGYPSLILRGNYGTMDMVLFTETLALGDA